MTPIVNRCSCGKTYTRREWEQLEYVGVMNVDRPLELRNCVCRSTRAIEIEVQPTEDRHASY